MLCFSVAQKHCTKFKYKNIFENVFITQKLRVNCKAYISTQMQTYFTNSNLEVEISRLAIDSIEISRLPNMFEIGFPSAHTFSACELLIK